MRSFFTSILLTVQLSYSILFSEVPFLFKQKNLTSSVNINEKEKALISHVERSIKWGNSYASTLKINVLSLEGLSSAKVRHFLNNLCSLPNGIYLEIGTWKGATFISALKNNQQFLKYAIAIDNWSQFNGPKNEFIRSCNRLISKNKYKFYSQDAFSINLDEMFPDPINIYFYDGEHSALSQELAFTYYDQVFDDVFIAVIDDWNWDCVREGTFNAFKKLNYLVLFEQFLPSRFTNDTKEWWNGLYVTVIKKNEKY